MSDKSADSFICEEPLSISLDEDIHTHYESLQEKYGQSRLIFQIENIKDISVPVSNIESSNKPLLHVTLTNGVCSVCAVILDTIKGLDINTLPGVKVVVEASVCEDALRTNGTFLVSSHQCCVLGGHVKARVIEWEKEKLTKQRYFEDRFRGGPSCNNSDKPPQFIPFDPVLIIQPSSSTAEENVLSNKEIENIQKTVVVETKKVVKEENSSKKKSLGSKKDKDKPKKSKKPIQKELTGVVSGFVVFTVDEEENRLFLQLEGSSIETLLPGFTTALVAVSPQIQGYLLSDLNNLKNLNHMLVVERLKALMKAFLNKEHLFHVEIYSKPLFTQSNVLAAYPSCENTTTRMAMHALVSNLQPI